MTRSQSPKTKPEDGLVKRRACDECRARKLACSKEPDGCSRCRRDGLKCVYSPQKPMGRPRKRRLFEANEEQPTDSRASNPIQGASEKPAPDHLQALDQSTDISAGSGGTMIGFDTDFSWYNCKASYNGSGNLDTTSSALFLNVPSADKGRIAPSTLPLDFSTDLDTMFGESSLPSNQFDFQLGGTNLLDGIHFEESHPPNTQVSVFQDINDDFAGILSSFETIQTESSSATAAPLFFGIGGTDTGDTGDTGNTPAAPPLDPLSVLQGYGHGDVPGESWSTSEGSSPEPSLQTPRSDAVAPENTNTYTNTNTNPVPASAPSSARVHSHKALPQAPCACLSQIYLSLDSLSRLPEDVGLAMSVARAAAKAAHDVVSCAACSKPFVGDATVPLPIQSFQNMMMLGALIPTTVNAYMKILELVDEATSQARQKGEPMVFRFSDYGGLWGRLGEMDKASGRGTVEMYDNRVMEPDQWRHTVRAVLKVDLYGFQVDGRTSLDGSVVRHSHPGLRDVVTAMEDRSNRRHDNFDALVAAGRQPVCGQSAYHMPTPPYDPGKKSDRPCLKIIEMARLSLEKVAIS